jgi:predicted AAA+ superfamily ATPase
MSLVLLDSIALSLHSLVLFRGLLEDAVIQSILRIADKKLSVTERLLSYTRLAAQLHEKSGGDIGRYMLDLVLHADNLYLRQCVKGGPIEAELEICLFEELLLLQLVSRLTPEDLRPHTGYGGYLPSWRSTEFFFSEAYKERMANVHTAGYGIYAKFRMFRIEADQIVPVLHPDTVRLSDLKEYEAERKAVDDNTQSLLLGKPSANALLYGDAGTGKSSTVKALVNEYWEKGLRLIQVLPSQFGLIPSVMERLFDNPLKFLLFIDDLSFAEQNDEFTALKAVLEGCVVQKAPNVAIYATSNRMHLVKELFSGRESDDIHRSETIAELCSLSERFGLCVGFYKPDKALYLKIVRQLMAQHGLSLGDMVLDIQAEQFALSHGGRSPRAARQFVDLLASKES